MDQGFRLAMIESDERLLGAYNMATIEEKIIEDFIEDCNEDLLRKMIKDFKKEKLIKDCLMSKWNLSFYKEDLMKVIKLNIYYMKKENEKKLALTRGFYSLYDDKDILDMIHEFLKR